MIEAAGVARRARRVAAPRARPRHDLGRRRALRAGLPARQRRSCSSSELTLRFTIGDPTHDGERLLGLVAAGRLDPTPVITHRIALADAAEAYRLFDAREATKVVLRP